MYCVCIYYNCLFCAVTIIVLLLYCVYICLVVFVFSCLCVVVLCS